MFLLGSKSGITTAHTMNSVNTHMIHCTVYRQGVGLNRHMVVKYFLTSILVKQVMINVCQLCLGETQRDIEMLNTSHSVVTCLYH